MIRKSLIALATVATIGLGTAATSQAKTIINVDLFGGGYGGGFYGGGFYGGGYGGYGCGWQWVAYKKWNWSHTHYCRQAFHDERRAVAAPRLASIMESGRTSTISQ